METVFNDLDQNKYSRGIVSGSALGVNDINEATRGEITFGSSVKFEGVPIYAPNGDK